MLKAAKNLRELRIHLCTNSSNSDGVREFLVQNYQNLKKQNPSLPILVRESAGVEAIAYYRFGKGVEKSVRLDGLGVDKVKDILYKFE